MDFISEIIDSGEEFIQYHNVANSETIIGYSLLTSKYQYVNKIPPSRLRQLVLIPILPFCFQKGSKLLKSLVFRLK